MNLKELVARNYRIASSNIATAAVTFTVGVWVGVWSVPTRALDVPTTSTIQNGEQMWHAAYQPVPNDLPVLSVAVVLIGLWAATNVYLNNRPDDDVETDGFDFVDLDPEAPADD